MVGPKGIEAGRRMRQSDRNAGLCDASSHHWLKDKNVIVNHDQIVTERSRVTAEARREQASSPNDDYL